MNKALKDRFYKSGAAGVAALFVQPSPVSTWRWRNVPPLIETVLVNVARGHSINLIVEARLS